MLGLKSWYSQLPPFSFLWIELTMTQKPATGMLCLFRVLSIAMEMRGMLLASLVKPRDTERGVNR